jgi:hypothetical protein
MGMAHWPGDHWQKEKGGDYFRSKAPLSNLLVELMLLCASSPGFCAAPSETVIYMSAVLIRPAGLRAVGALLQPRCARTET